MWRVLCGGVCAGDGAGVCAERAVCVECAVSVLDCGGGVCGVVFGDGLGVVTGRAGGGWWEGLRLFILFAPFSRYRWAGSGRSAFMPFMAEPDTEIDNG